MDTVKLHCLCKYTMNTQTLNSESRLISSLLKIYANCPDSQPRNKAKNALSLVRPFSLGLATAKIEKNSEVQGLFGKNVYFCT